MNAWILAHETTVRLTAYCAMLAAMAAAEAMWRRRQRDHSRWRRWPSNIGIAALDAVLVRLVLPATAVSVAAAIEAQQGGLMAALDLPEVVAIVLAVVVLDLAIYLQHVLFHAVPVLWRLHRMHHADLDFDVTTGVRFHPVEILLSMGLRLGVIAALGPPAVAVLIFELLLNVGAMFNHGNLRLPVALDRVLRWLVVTPDMHRVHHSVVASETNSNFGFTLPWWDRLFGTYRAQPAAGHGAMAIGIEQFRAPRDLWLDRMLVQPLRGPASGYPIDRGGG